MVNKVLIVLRTLHAVSQYETASGQFYENMALANVDEIEIRVKGLCLLWRFPDAWQVAYSSVTETELVTCEEESIRGEVIVASGWYDLITHPPV